MLGWDSMFAGADLEAGVIGATWNYGKWLLPGWSGGLGSWKPIGFLVP